jgi:tRNA(Glu) U13 pseudouridine synthase TruD
LPQRLQLRLSDFAAAGFNGGRRPLMLPLPDDFSAVPCEEGMRFTFTLPAGAYATSLLREFMKIE